MTKTYIGCNSKILFNYNVIISINRRYVNDDFFRWLVIHSQ